MARGLNRATTIGSALCILGAAFLSGCVGSSATVSKPKEEPEAQVLRYFDVAGEANAKPLVIKQDYRISAGWNNTKIQIDEYSRQITAMSRFPAWYEDHPIDSSLKESLTSVEQAESRLVEVLRALDVEDLKHEVVARYELKGDLSKELVPDGRRVYVLVIFEKKSDPRYHQDGLRRGTVIFCASTGQLLKFNLSLASPEGSWSEAELEVEPAEAAEVLWEKWASEYPIARIEMKRMWAQLSPKPVNGKLAPLATVVMVKGLNKDGDLRCFFTADPKTGKILANQCGEFVNSVNWDGRTWRIREMDGSSRAALEAP